MSLVGTEERHYVGEVGTEILVNCGCTITGATGTSLKIIKPDGSTATWTATISGTTHLTYTTITGDFNLAGEYILQAYLTINGWTGHGTVIVFTVYAVGDDEE